MSLHQQAGYTEAILSLSRDRRGLANVEETIYGPGNEAQLGVRGKGVNR